jgi:hypothetical protein
MKWARISRFKPGLDTTQERQNSLSPRLTWDHIFRRKKKKKKAKVKKANNT